MKATNENRFKNSDQKWIRNNKLPQIIDNENKTQNL